MQKKGGPTLGPMLKSLYLAQKGGGGPDPLDVGVRMLET